MASGMLHGAQEEHQRDEQSQQAAANLSHELKYPRAFHDSLADPLLCHMQ